MDLIATFATPSSLENTKTASPTPSSNKCQTWGSTLALIDSRAGRAVAGASSRHRLIERLDSTVNTSGPQRGEQGARKARRDLPPESLTWGLKWLMGGSGDNWPPQRAWHRPACKLQVAQTVSKTHAPDPAARCLIGIWDEKRAPKRRFDLATWRRARAAPNELSAR